MVSYFSFLFNCSGNFHSGCTNPCIEFNYTVFHVTDQDGNKLTDESVLSYIEEVLIVAYNLLQMYLLLFKIYLPINLVVGFYCCIDNGVLNVLCMLCISHLGAFTMGKLITQMISLSLN